MVRSTHIVQAMLQMPSLQPVWRVGCLLPQASPKEIQAELAAMGAVELGGYWRRVDPGYLGSLLELLIKWWVWLHLIIARGDPLDQRLPAT